MIPDVSLKILFDCQETKAINENMSQSLKYMKIFFCLFINELNSNCNKNISIIDNSGNVIFLLESTDFLTILNPSFVKFINLITLKFQTEIKM